MNLRDVVNNLRQALTKRRQKSDIENVVPIIVPRNYFEQGNWPGPYMNLRSEFLALTWTILFPDDVMVYVNQDHVAKWEHEKINWKEKALQNLLRISHNQLWTDEKRDSNGQLLWMVMMHSDGLGSSRLLLNKEIRKVIGEKYRVGLPDRSCAFVIPEYIEIDNLIEVTSMVQNIFEKATIPMLSDLLEPGDLESGLQQT